MSNYTSAMRVPAAVACIAAVAVLSSGCASTNLVPSASGTLAATGTSTSSSGVGDVTLPAQTQASSTPAASGTALGSGSVVGSATGTPRCHTRDLSASFTAVPHSVGAGNILYNIKLTNTSGHTCTIYGFPGMLLLDANHRPLPTNLQWGTTSVKRLVTLRPGGTAAATDRFSPDVPGTGDHAPATPGPGWTCQPKSVYVEITPPDETAHLVAAVSPATPVCEGGGMGASAFVPGPTGPNQG
jgi:hypothetical protein